MPRQLRGSRTKAELSRDTKSIDAAGIFVGPQVLFVHMKPTHEPQNPMVYGVHRRTPFTNNTMSQAYAVPEITATRRGTSGRTSSRCSTRSARCVLLQQRMLQAPTHTNRQGCERADAGKDWSTRVAGRLPGFVEDNRSRVDQLSSTNALLKRRSCAVGAHRTRQTRARLFVTGSLAGWKAWSPIPQRW